MGHEYSSTTARCCFPEEIRKIILNTDDAEGKLQLSQK